MRRTPARDGQDDYPSDWGDFVVVVNDDDDEKEAYDEGGRTDEEAAQALHEVDNEHLRRPAPNEEVLLG